MSRVIWKYELAGRPINDLVMPEGAEVIEVAAQGPNLCLWAIVDPDAPRTTRCFQVVGTGHRALTGAERYVGTAHMAEYQLVLHVFERAKRVDYAQVMRMAGFRL